jgi:hypothetical protein
MVLFLRFHARVAELVDAHDSKSCGATHEGSIPSPGTNTFTHIKLPTIKNLLLKTILIIALVLLLPACFNEAEKDDITKTKKRADVPPMTYVEVMLEEGVDRGFYPPIKKLIGVNSEGVKTVIAENTNYILPISKYGQAQGRDQETDDLYTIPFIYSFYPEGQKIYLGRSGDGTDIYDYIHEYDLRSGQIKTLPFPLTEKYIFSYNSYDKISPDGIKVAMYSSDGVGIFDLIKNEEILFIKGESVDGILALERDVLSPGNESFQLFRWRSSKILEYPIYEETEEENVYKLKGVEIIKLD